MKIRIGAHTFHADVYDDPMVRKFKALLPFSLKMKELNRNEKYAELSTDLNALPCYTGKITAGDIMIYGSSTLVLFYQSFFTRYSYTTIGRINDVSGFADALGSGDVDVRFESD